MAFGGKMDQSRRAGSWREYRSTAVAVADIGTLEAIARVAGDRVERGEAGGVGELVEVDDLVSELADEIAADRRTDEAGAAGDQDPHLAFGFAHRPE